MRPDDTPLEPEWDDEKPRRRPRPWGALTMGLMVFFTFLLPLIGIVLGIIDISGGNPRKRMQGAALLALGLVMTLVYAIAMAR